MTVLFLILLSVFCLIALGQLSWASHCPSRATKSSTDLSLRQWYQAETHALKQQLTRAEISQASYEQNQLALQREYLLTQANVNLAKPSTHVSLTITLLLGLLLISLCAEFYWHQGTAHTLLHFYQVQKNSQQAETELNRLGGADKVIASLQTLLKKHPSDPRAWYLLGRLYFTNNHYSLAVTAFSHANILLPNQLEVELSLAESCYLSGQHAAKAAYYLQRVLQQDPTNPGALNLTALIAYQQHHYSQAIAVWQQLLQQVPENSDTAKTLQRAIAKARHATH